VIGRLLRKLTEPKQHGTFIIRFTKYDIPPLIWKAHSEKEADELKRLCK